MTDPLPGLIAAREIEAVARALCANDGYDPDYAGTEGAGWIHYEAAATVAIAAIAPERKSAEGKEWRCFHCDEVFVTAETAREHFGADEICEPACKIDIAEYRRLEDQQASCRAECCEEAKRYYAMQADHAQALIREEQKGYDKGLADGRALRPSPIPPAKESAHGVIADIVRDVCDLDYTSPDNQPNLLQVTTGELMAILENRLVALRAKPDAGAFAGDMAKALEIFACECSGRCEEFEWLPAGNSSCAYYLARAILARYRAAHPASPERAGKEQTNG